MTANTASLLIKAHLLAVASGRIITSLSKKERIISSSEEQETRTAICRMCEFFTGTTCKKCGCHIRFKARLQTEHCPINKW